MDFSEIKDKVTDFFSKVKEKISDFVSENKVISIAISTMLLLIIICIILISAMGKKKKKINPLEIKLNLSYEQQLPDGPELPRNYNLFRESKEKWTEEEGRQWFTIPTEKEVNSLSLANDSMINEIIEAAP